MKNTLFTRRKKEDTGKRCARFVGAILLSALLVGGGCMVVSAEADGVMPISEESAALWNTALGSAGNSSPKRSTEVISYGLDVIAAEDEIVFAGLVGNEIGFKAEDIKRAMNLSELNYITVTELPAAVKGTLYIGSVGVSKGQVITAGNIPLMSYDALDDRNPSEAVMRISVNGSAYSVECRMCMLTGLNYTPTVSLVPDISLRIMTYRDTPAYGNLSAYDPEGDEITYEIVKYASHGRVNVTDKHTGAYIYTPDSGFTGQDSFVYVVRDQYGNYSTSAEVNLEISAPPSSVTYEDIGGDSAPYASAALRVTSAGIMNGTQVGDGCYFKPCETMSRAEFLVTAMNCAGIKASDVSSYTKTDFADDADIPTSMKGYIALAKSRGYIGGKEIDGKLCFVPNEAISRAEAAVILSNIIGYANKTTVNAFADANEMPAWADEAMTSLYALGILDARDGSANPSEKINRGTAAVWFSSTMQLIEGANGK